MSGFRLGALRDLFGKSDSSKSAKTEAPLPKPQASLELVPKAEDVPEPEDVSDQQEQQGARDKPVARAVRKPAEASDSYTAADIEVLEGLEPVRRRPGMYVGGTDEKAL
ncbi:MAG TPA: DNA topoisomerase IV subunit B, partial [Hyphomicrobiaceae bacterium]|nr:DNA topoisomerase IV subunit B [Hyphomicrobiaceae bacterium]